MNSTRLIALCIGMAACLSHAAGEDDTLGLADTAADMPVHKLCLNYGNAVLNKYRINAITYLGELRRRKVPIRIEGAYTEDLKIGDSLCTLLAVKGMYQSQNETVTAGRTDIQYVYGNGAYVYTRNGKVSAMQMSQ